MPSRCQPFHRRRNSAAILLLALMACGCSSAETEEEAAATAVASASVVLRAWLDRAVPTAYTVATVLAMRDDFDQAIDELNAQNPAGPLHRGQAAMVHDALAGAVAGLRASDAAKVADAAHRLSMSEFVRPRKDQP